MANIESVRLPDNSVFNLKDAVSGYASKVTGATSGNLAGLDANGDLTDSGVAASVIGTKTPSDSIAPTENGATASKAYENGDSFFRNGFYCECISPISVNAALTENTNYKITSLGKRLVYYKDITGTVNAYSGIEIGLADKVVFAIAPKNPPYDYLVFPLWSRALQRWYAHCVTTGFQPIAENTQLSLTVYYFTP